MNKIIRLFLLMLAILLLIVPALSASSFELRNGIQWGISELDVYRCLQTEPGYNQYVIHDESDSTEIQERLYKISPNEKTNPQFWCVEVESGISLGDSNEKVSLFLLGTKTYGLYVAKYYISPNNKSDDCYYNRAKELTTQLSKKYGKFKQRDEWKKRKNKICLRIIKVEDGYSMHVEYQSEMIQEITKCIEDGTLYIEPAFGL